MFSSSQRLTIVEQFWPQFRSWRKLGLIASAPFSFTLSFDEFIRTIFVIGFDRTIPVQFWSMIVDELRPGLPAVAVVIIVFSAVVSLVGFAFSNRGRR